MRRSLWRKTDDIIHHLTISYSTSASLILEPSTIPTTQQLSGGTGVTCPMYRLSTEPFRLSKARWSALQKRICSGYNPGNGEKTDRRTCTRCHPLFPGAEGREVHSIAVWPVVQLLLRSLVTRCAQWRLPVCFLVLHGSWIKQKPVVAARH